MVTVTVMVTWQMVVFGMISVSHGFTPLNQLVYAKAFLSVFKNSILSEVFDENILLREALRPSMPSSIDICYYLLMAASCIRWEEGGGSSKGGPKLGSGLVGPLARDARFDNDSKNKWTNIELYSVSKRRFRIFLWIFTVIFFKNVTSSC